MTSLLLDWISIDHGLQVRPLTKLYLKSPLHPLTSYFFTYLLAGWYDGSHFNPFGE